MGVHDNAGSVFMMRQNMHKRMAYAKNVRDERHEYAEDHYYRGGYYGG